MVEVVKLTREEVDTRTNTFKITIKLADYEKALQPEIWPYRVGVRHYRPPRRQQGLSWDQQTRGGRSTENEQSHSNGRQHHGRDQQVVSEQTPFSLPLKNRFDALIGQNGDAFTTPN